MALLTVVATASAAAAQGLDERAAAAERRADDAIALCATADDLPPDARLPVLARGLVIAESAVELSEHSARAHYAIVCNLGKAIGLSGVGLGTWRAVSRLRREIEATLALAPDDPEALAAKGALLVKLPRWLGGDRGEAERWLRRALAMDPTNATARAYLEQLGAGPHVAPAADIVVR
ncbi:MAG: hypothetical protein IT294_11355 [Deltaproteobacteria bacterium]|nr:hypothetical protein [Deltaproteobacteria bacterium]